MADETRLIQPKFIWIIAVAKINRLKILVEGSFERLDFLLFNAECPFEKSNMATERGRSRQVRGIKNL